MSNFVSNVDRWNTNVECLFSLRIEERMMFQIIGSYSNFGRKYAP